ncbi:hypothetical protein MMC24_007483 [Lignoscripta atroalba]|nr:hypothetical protein [Lignoscripta atroalba]
MELLSQSGRSSCAQLERENVRLEDKIRQLEEQNRTLQEHVRAHVPAPAPFRFPALPPEIRNHIYRMVLVDQKPIKVSYRTEYPLVCPFHNCLCKRLILHEGNGSEEDSENVSIDGGSASEGDSDSTSEESNTHDEATNAHSNGNRASQACNVNGGTIDSTESDSSSDERDLSDRPAAEGAGLDHGYTSEESLSTWAINMANRRASIPIAQCAFQKAKSALVEAHRWDFSRISLLASCRQMYDETNGIYYGQNIFTGFLRWIQKFCNDIGTQCRSHIRTICLDRIDYRHCNHLLTRVSLFELVNLRKLIVLNMVHPRYLTARTIPEFSWVDENRRLQTMTFLCSLSTVEISRSTSIARDRLKARDSYEQTNVDGILQRFQEEFNRAVLQGFIQNGSWASTGNNNSSPPLTGPDTD